MISADTNLFIYAANASSPHCATATEFIKQHQNNEHFVICELIIVELYMALRNPAIFPRPLNGEQAHAYCQNLKHNQAWQIIDYTPDISAKLWDWLKSNPSCRYRHIIDARIAFTLLHHGVTEFATANLKDFQQFDFQRVWNPMGENAGT